MIQTARSKATWLILVTTLAMLTLLIAGQNTAEGQITPIPTPDPKPGSFGIEAVKTQPPPTRGATITTPGNGAAFTTSPITVSGICPDELLVQIFNNDVMVGSTICTGGSFQSEVSLFAGTNELSAMVYDEIEQSGPESDIVTVTYTDTNFTAFGQLITLTSSFGRRSAPAGNQLTWPLQLSGGTGPYAFSIEWGDGSEAQLISQPTAGIVNVDHVYKQAGIYQVNVRVTDTNGVSAFIQLIAVSSGQIDPKMSEDEGEELTQRTEVLWTPAAAAVGLLFPSFWLGRRSQLVSLGNKMMKERDSYQD